MLVIPSLLGDVSEKMEEVFAFAKKTVNAVLPRCEGEGRTGFLLTIMCGTPNGGMWQTRTIGMPALAKKDKYHYFSGEKPWRALCAGHLASMDTADSAKERYTGGIVMPPWCYGVSGLDARDDHCLAVLYAVKAGGYDLEKARSGYLIGMEDRFENFLAAVS